MEAQNDEEAAMYVSTLNETLLYVSDEIKHQVDFTSELQLFQLFRSISPESHEILPNRFRDNLVQIGSYLCPDAKEVPALVSELFYNINQIKNPIVRAIYFHQ